jgi:hypothetical protein
VRELDRCDVNAPPGGQADQRTVIGDFGDHCSLRPHSRPETVSGQDGAAFADVVEQSIVVEKRVEEF